MNFPAFLSNQYINSYRSATFGIIGVSTLPNEFGKPFVCLLTIVGYFGYKSVGTYIDSAFSRRKTWDTKFCRFNPKPYWESLSQHDGERRTNQATHNMSVLRKRVEKAQNVALSPFILLDLLEKGY